MKKPAIWYYLLLPLIQPGKRLKRLLDDARRVRLGLLAFTLLGLLYTVTVYVGYRRGFGAVTEPFLAIPAERYYLWETFFALPVFLLMLIVFAGCARLLSRFFAGKGTFENILAVFSMALTVPMLLTLWLPESTLIILFPGSRLQPLGGFRAFPFWIDILRQLLSIIWPLAVTVVGIRLSEKIKTSQALVVALLAFIPTAALILIFIR